MSRDGSTISKGIRGTTQALLGVFQGRCLSPGTTSASQGGSSPQGLQGCSRGMRFSRHREQRNPFLSFRDGISLAGKTLLPREQVQRKSLIPGNGASLAEETLILMEHVQE